LPDGTNTPRQLSDLTGDITLSARYTPWGDTLDTYGTGNFTFGYLILGVAGSVSFGDPGGSSLSSEVSASSEIEEATVELESETGTEPIIDPYNVMIEDGSPTWQGLIIGDSQDSFVTFTNIHTLIGEQHSNGIWSEDSIQVLYDISSQRIQIWAYSAEDGWTQRGADIPVTFADGDVFQARALEDGTVEIGDQCRGRYKLSGYRSARVGAAAGESLRHGGV
jgi:hypothetical protein